MGIPPFNIVSSVNLIMAQRLGRRLCEYCKTPVDYPDEVLLSNGFKETDLGTIQMFRPMECDKCNDGYKGRVGIYQVMPLSEKCAP